MSKTKKQIILFIIIIIFGITYSIIEYVINPKKLLLDQKAQAFQSENARLNLLKSKSLQVDSLRKKVQELKETASSIDSVTVKDIDTPQLIYDFYNSCKKYEIKGENLTFQLADSTSKTDKPSTLADPAKLNNNQAASNNSLTNAAVIQPNNSKDQSGDAKNPAEASGLQTLTIELKVSGDKNKVEEFIRNLNTITERKLNVKSIKLEATSQESSNSMESSAASSAVVSDGVAADIIFNQYMYNENKAIDRRSNYDFYDGQTGYESFSDMFN